MNYWLHPEAQEDLREAAEFYRQQAGAALSQTLFGEFERAVGRLLIHPGLGAVWLRGRRRLVLRGFPYSLIYSVVKDEIRVLAFAHQSRRPSYWRHRK